MGLNPHFVSINSMHGAHIPRCACGWIGHSHQLNKHGEQGAKDEALMHRGGQAKKNEVSRVASSPIYAFEVERD